VRGALIDLGACPSIAAADEHVPDLKMSGALGQSRRECVAYTIPSLSRKFLPG